MEPATPTVLLVEDDPEDREAVRRLLLRAEFPCQLLEANTGAQAISLLSAGGVDCVLLDYFLPDGNAAQLIPKAMRAMVTPVPVVVLTGVGDEKVATETMKLGAHDYLPKSELQAKPLRGAIESAMTRAAAQREVADKNRELEHRSLHDALTDLPNRRLFFDRLVQARARSQRSAKKFAVLMMDLDRFKEINDTLGHDAGDQLLVTVSKRLRSTLRNSDTLARLGGDEFAAVVEGFHDISDVTQIATKLCDTVSTPVMLSGEMVSVGISIGIVIAQSYSEQADTLLGSADAAMYEAKRSHEGFAVYSQATPSPVNHKGIIASQLTHALDDNDLLLVYQPQFNLASSKAYGVEALVRWRHPEFGLLPPMKFIPIAERARLIKPLTIAVLDLLCEDYLRFEWDACDLRVSFNLSACLLDDDGIAEDILARLVRRGVPPEQVTLEVKETGLMTNPDSAQHILSALKEAGVAISIDDFGAGYTSLRYLRDMPLSELKIDPLFLRALRAGSRDASIVQSIIELGLRLGARVVAEGIESFATHDTLRMLGCQHGQGFLYARPMSGQDVRSSLSSFHTQRPLPPGSIEVCTGL